MDISEIQNDTKISVRVYDDGRKMSIKLEKLSNPDVYTVINLSRNTTLQIAAALHCKELSTALKKIEKKAI